MRFTYDDEADALYIRLDGDEPVARSVVVDKSRVVDLNKEGRPVGIEVLGASTGVHVMDLIEPFGLDPGYLVPFKHLEETTFLPAASA